MPRIPQYTDEQVIEAVRESNSVRQVLLKLGLKPVGGNYNTIKRLVERLQLNTSHFLGQAIHRGQCFGPKRPINDYLSNKHPIKSFRLKGRLIQEGIFDHKCSHCGNTKWFNQPIPLELDHINGNHDDNSLDNIRLLCPNCHALTPTYRGKNISRA